MATTFKACSVDGCNADASKIAFGCRGFCSLHYQRLRKNGGVHIVKCKRVPMGTRCGVLDCEKPYHAHGYCSAHVSKYRKYGDPLQSKPHPRNGMRKRWIDERVTFSGDGCLEFPFSRNQNGRGIISVGGNSIGASRYMCIIAHGESEQPDLVAAHSCGNGHLGCVNPRHLRWATTTENENDKRIHGTLRMGEQINTSKLTKNEAAFVKSSRQSGVSLSRMFGVSTAAVSAIRTGKNWKSA